MLARHAGRVVPAEFKNSKLDDCWLFLCQWNVISYDTYGTIHRWVIISAIQWICLVCVTPDSQSKKQRSNYDNYMDEQVVYPSNFKQLDCKLLDELIRYRIQPTNCRQLPTYIHDTFHAFTYKLKAIKIDLEVWNRFLPRPFGPHLDRQRGVGEP